MVEFNTNEISLRNEVMDLITGDDFGIDKYTPIIHRQLRQNSGKFEYCVCWNEQSKEGTIGCPYCDSIGILWDERIIPGFIYFITKKSIVNTYDNVINEWKIICISYWTNSPTFFINSK